MSERKDPEVDAAGTGTMDCTKHSIIKDTPKSVPFGDDSLDVTNLATNELEDKTKTDLEHLFQSPEYKTVLSLTSTAHDQALAPTSSY